MSRPFRTLFALCLVAYSVGLSGCDTIYRPVYSNQKNYFKPPDANGNQKGPQLTAEQVLQQTDSNGGPGGAAAQPAPADAGGMMPAAPPAAPDAAPAAPPAIPPPPPQ
jgi:hypothetical protein